MEQLNKWIDFLNWCPSECYYYFKTEEGRYKCIYLYWRHDDPWLVWLINFIDDSFNWDTANWTDVNLKKDYCAGEEDALKKKVLEIVGKLYKIQGDEANKKPSLLQRLWKIKDAFRFRKGS